MMGDGWLPNAQALAQFSDTQPGTGIRITIMPLTAFRKP
jgi:hypothetical protein